MRIASILCALAAAAAGCDADCDNPSRIDGSYAVWSNATGEDFVFTVEGDMASEPDAYKVAQACFANGWSEWDLTYVPSKDKVQVKVDGDSNTPYSATFQQDPDNCNAFTMSFGGTYVSEEGTNHLFTWTGELAYMGSHIVGTYTYKDTWTHPDGTGTLEIPAGELHANLRSGEGTDTGF